MNFCDSHCHPSDNKFDGDIENVLQEAKERGMNVIIGNACRCNI